MSNVQKLRLALADGIRPAELLDLAEWAEQNVRLSPEDSASRGAFTAWPFQVEPMQCMSPRHPAEKVVIVAASQTMKTRLLLNFLGFVIDCDPGPVLFVEPTARDAETLSKDRVTPMLRDTPCLRGKVAEAKSRDAGNTIDHKRFFGGHVSFSIALSPSSLSARPIRYLLMDEISRDEYDAGKEGDPIELAIARTATFWNRKLFFTSSPASEGSCRISAMFADSDQRQWHVPCPHCGREQILEWSGLVWSSKGQPVTWHENGAEVSGIIDPAEPRYRCVGCDALIEERHKADMNAKGRYIAMNPAGKYPGFRANALISPVVRWGELVEKFQRCHGDPGKMRVFVNTVLAQTWKEIGEAPDWEKVHARREPRSMGAVPEGVLFLTAGVDVQGDRIEASLYGWGRNRERWLIEHEVFLGKPSEQKVWNELSSWRSKTWRHPAGHQMSILRFGIDTGFETSAVYQWVRQQADPAVLAIDGRSSIGGMILGQPRHVDINLAGRVLKRGVKIWPVDVSKLKHEFYGCLNLPRPEAGEPFPSGWVHLPEVDKEFCEQLTAEEVVTTKTPAGYPKTSWVKRRPRNEALDCAVYARAAAHQVGIDAFRDRDWAKFEVMNAKRAAIAAEMDAVPATAEVAPVAPAMPMPRVKPRVVRSSWMDR